MNTNLSGELSPAAIRRVWWAYQWRMILMSVLIGAIAGILARVLAISLDLEKLSTPAWSSPLSSPIS
jgi:ABC-type Mn2+/Zn2+ transport system permease subunit